MQIYYIILYFYLYKKHLKLSKREKCLKIQPLALNLSNEIDLINFYKESNTRKFENI